MRRVSLPICVMIKRGDGGLLQDSVALCFQLRVLDKIRLVKRLGQLSLKTIAEIEEVVLVTLGY